MSRYVDLDGLTWDGNTINSKIQEVETRRGFMSAITIGWLYGDNVPHIDLDEYESQVREDERRKFAEWLQSNGYFVYVMSTPDGLLTDEVTVDYILAEYEKEQKGETE